MRNLKKFSLIVPIAADKQEYENRMPLVFRFDNEGIMLCIKSIMGLNLEIFNTIYFTILRKHAIRFDIDKILQLQLARMGLINTKIVILDKPTDSQPQTVIDTIIKEGITGSVFIKDADCFFSANILPENGIAIFPLENLQYVDPQNKSYVAVDDMQHITNIIEKRIVSNMFNAGGYCFEDIQDFIDSYKKNSPFGNVYMSHLIYSLLIDGHIFRPIGVNNYIDWNLTFEDNDIKNYV